MFGDIENGEGVPEDYASMGVSVRDDEVENAQSKGEAGGGSGWQNNGQFIGVHRGHGRQYRAVLGKLAGVLVQQAPMNVDRDTCGREVPATRTSLP